MIMNRKYSFVVTSLLLLIVFMGFCDASSLPSANEEVSKMGLVNGEDYCSLEACKELRERVESLEETVRAIVSALSDKKNHNFVSVSQKTGKNRAIRSVLFPSSTAPSVDDAGQRDRDLFPEQPVRLLSSTTSTPAPSNSSSKLLIYLCIYLYMGYTFLLT